MIGGLSLLQTKAQRVFTDEEDVFLVVLMHRFGYGNWERIRMEIRKVRDSMLIWSRTATQEEARRPVVMAVALNF